MAFTPPKTDKPHGKVTRETWISNAAFLSLPAPKPNSRFLWLYLLTGPDINIIPGLLTRMGIGTLADRLQWPYQGTLKCWTQIQRAELADADWTAQVIYIPTGIIDNPPANPNQILGWAKVPLPHCPLVIRALQAIRARMAMKTKEGFLQAFDEGFLKRFPEITAPPVPTLHHDDDVSGPNGSMNGLGDGSGNQEQDQEQDQDRTPLTPLAGGRVSTRQPSKVERDWAETYLRNLSVHCPHTNAPCVNHNQCIGRLVMWRRNEVAKGMQQELADDQAEEVAPS